MAREEIEPPTRGFSLAGRNTRPVPTTQVLSLRHFDDRVLSPVVWSRLVFGHRFGLEGARLCRWQMREGVPVQRQKFWREANIVLIWLVAGRVGLPSGAVHQPLEPRVAPERRQPARRSRR